MSKGTGKFEEAARMLVAGYNAHAVLLLVMGETLETTGCSLAVAAGPTFLPARRAMVETLRRIADAMEAELREEEQ